MADEPEIYLPITVDTARRISDEFRKDWVLILAYDGLHEMTHATSFAHMAGSKALVADLADVCLRAIGICLDGAQTHEDWRLVPASLAAQQIGDLKTQVENLQAQLARVNLLRGT